MGRAQSAWFGREPYREVTPITDDLQPAQRWLDGSYATGMDPDARSASVVQPNRRRGITGVV